MDISKLVGQEVAWLAQQEAGALQGLLGVYQNTFLEIEAKLKANPKDTYSTRHLKAVHSQIGAVFEEMRTKHSNLLGNKVKYVFRYQIPRDRDAWAKLEKTFGDPKMAKQFADFKAVIPARSMKHLVTVQDIAIKGFSDELAAKTRAAVAQSMALGEGTAQTIRRLKAIECIPQHQNRLHLIARMEVARASNLAKIEHVEQLQKEFPDREYWLMVKDHVVKEKKTRNHWFSWAISGTVRNVTKGESFEIHTAQMNDAKVSYKAITGKKASDNGLLWQSFALGRRGKAVPAHFWDRAVLVPWDPAWNGATFGDAKHPQGPTKPKPKSVAEENLPQPPLPMPEAARAQEQPEPVPEKKPARQRIRDRNLAQLVFEQPDQPKNYDPIVFEDDMTDFLKAFQKKSPTGFQRPVHKSLWKFEEEILDEPLEHMCIFDELGKVPFKLTGQYNQVQLDWHVVAPYRNLRLSHNHPEPILFSAMDIISAALSNMKELRVVFRFEGDKYLGSIERQGKYWRKKNDDMWDKGWRWTMDDISYFDRLCFDYEQDKLAELRASGVSAVQASFEASHYAIEQACKKLGVTYRLIRQPSL